MHLSRDLGHHIAKAFGSKYDKTAVHGLVTCGLRGGQGGVEPPNYR